MDLKALPPRTMVTAAIETPMKTVLEINHLTGLPVPILDGDKRVLGVVGTAEIFQGILRETKPAAIKK